NKQATEYSHFFFSKAVNQGFSSLFATHPPLEKRIKRVHPRWSGKFTKVQKPQPQKSKKDTKSDSKEKLKEVFAAASVAVSKQKAVQSLEQSGVLKDANIKSAKALLQNLDAKLLQYAHDPYYVRVVVYGLLLSNETLTKQKQLQIIDSSMQEQKETKEIFSLTQSLQPQLRVMLVEIALLALNELSPNQYESFKKVVQKLIAADKKVSIYEWSLFKIITKNIEGVKYSSKSYELKECKHQIALVLWMLCYAGQKPQDVEAACKAGFKELQMQPLPMTKESLNFKSLDSALDRLLHLKPLAKLHLVRAMIECVSFNEVINQKEMQLLKAIAQSIDVALPPLENTD
ncbi:MAG: hypothetical protein ACQESH_06600, partial [Campylobacterota bacterium]